VSVRVMNRRLLVEVRPPPQRAGLTLPHPASFGRRHTLIGVVVAAAPDSGFREGQEVVFVRPEGNVPSAAWMDRDLVVAVLERGSSPPERPASAAVDPR